MDDRSSRRRPAAELLGCAAVVAFFVIAPSPVVFALIAVLLAAGGLRRLMPDAFRPRTLLIALFAVIAFGYVGWEGRIVWQRKAMLRHIDDVKGEAGTELTGQDEKINWIRRDWGDQWINHISLPPDTSKEERDRIQAVFPEAKFDRIMKRHPDGKPWMLQPFED